MRATSTWIVGAIILYRPKKSQWQQGRPPPRVRQGGVRERRRGEVSKRDARSIEFDAWRSRQCDGRSSS